MAGTLLMFSMGVLAGCTGKIAGNRDTQQPAFESDQASRGAEVFEKSCKGCHSLDSSSTASPVSLSGDVFRRRWRSVNDLYAFISTTMPADKVLSLTAQQQIDVTAYILQQNGFKPGAALVAERKAMAAMKIAPETFPAGIGFQSKDGYYTVAQAERGKAFFASSCGMCHSPSAKPMKAGEKVDPTFANISLVDQGGIRMGSIGAITHLAGPIFISQWPSVGSLYERIKDYMPEHKPDGLDPETYRDIVAYLLRSNGLPSGPDELPANQEQMDAMPIAENGFTILFNGKNFDGFGFLMGNGCTPQPDGCGSTRPDPAFGIRNREIATSGFPIGYMYTNKKYLNFTLRFEYKFDPSQGDRQHIYWGNSGYMLFITENRVWPKSLEIEGLDPIQLRPLGLDTLPRYSYDDDARKRATRPVGEWNAVDIVSKNGVVRSSLNGILVSVVKQHEFREPGYIGFQAENARMYWRNIRIRPE